CAAFLNSPSGSPVLVNCGSTLILWNGGILSSTSITEYLDSSLLAEVSLLRSSVKSSSARSRVCFNIHDSLQSSSRFEVAEELTLWCKESPARKFAAGIVAVVGGFGFKRGGKDDLGGEEEEEEEE